jgi:hypothetical protein
MATITDTPRAPASPGPDRLASNYPQVCYTILGLAAVFGIVSGVSFYLYRARDFNALPYALWGLSLCLVCLVAGAVGLVQGGGAPSGEARGEWARLHAQIQGERARLLILVVLGSVGLGMAVLGLALPFTYQEIFGKPFKVWREHALTVFLVLAVLFVGMLVLFSGLVLARRFGAGHPNLRRALYAYNAAVGTSLLACILVLANFLPYVQVVPFKYLSQTYDWTTSKIYSLSDQSKGILVGLKEPVRIYVLLGEHDRIAAEVETLLNNCRSVTPNLTWEVVNRDFNLEKARELYKEYQPPDIMGLLVVYGTKPGEKSEFIRRSDLIDVGRSDMMADRDSEEGQRFTFKGESALMKALVYLSEGKTQPTLYFAQGFGMMELEGRNPDQADRSLSRLRDEISGKGKRYEAKPLKVELDTASIPTDADVLVLAGPQRPLPDKFLKGVRDYLRGEGGRKKGRAIILLDPVVENGKLVRTGLEPLLTEFGVQAGNDRLMALANTQDPIAVTVIPDPSSSNPVAKAFIRGRTVDAFAFHNTRTMAPAGNQPAPGAATAEPLLVTLPEEGVWAETNLEASASELWKALRADRAKWREKLSPGPLTVASAVSEGKTPAPPFPGHEAMGKEGQPRLVAFGCVSWLSDQSLAARNGSGNVDLFTSCLSWLREKPDLGEGAEGKIRKEFRLTVPAGGGFRLMVLPAILVLLAVCALGSGIWVVRRR